MISALSVNACWVFVRADYMKPHSSSLTPLLTILSALEMCPGVCLGRGIGYPAANPGREPCAGSIWQRHYDSKHQLQPLWQTLPSTVQRLRAHCRGTAHQVPAGEIPRCLPGTSRSKSGLVWCGLLYVPALLVLAHNRSQCHIRKEETTSYGSAVL